MSTMDYYQPSSEVKKSLSLLFPSSSNDIRLTVPGLMETFSPKPSPSPRTKKRKRSVNPAFLAKYGIGEIGGRGVCVLCSKEIAEESLKPNKLQRHLDTHSNMASLPEEARCRIFQQRYNHLTKSQSSVDSGLSRIEETQIFSLKTAFLLAQRRIPFSVGGNILKPTLMNFLQIFEGEPFAKTVSDVADDVKLGCDVMSHHIQLIGADLKEQILEDFRNSPWVSLALDELFDVTAKPQLLVFGRFYKKSSVVEELLACIPLETIAKDDIIHTLEKFFTENKLDWSKVCECSVDGVPPVTKRIREFRGILSQMHPHIKTNHCITHRQGFSSNDLSPSFNDVMQIVVATVNYVTGKGLSCPIFKKLCRDESSSSSGDYQTLLLYSTVEWLSRGRTLEKVFLLRNELADFLHDEGHQNVHSFRDPHFLARLALLTDVYEHLNRLVTQLQGKGKWVFDFQCVIKAFISKLRILGGLAEAGNFSHFPHYLEFTATLDLDFDNAVDLTREKKDLLNYLHNLSTDINNRFPELLTQSFDFVQFPFKADAIRCGSFALEMADFQADNEARVDFHVQEDLAKFWVSLSKKHSSVRDQALQVLVQFGGAAICERAFLLMLEREAKYESQVSNSLENSLISSLTSYSPRYRNLIKP